MVRPPPSLMGPPRPNPTAPRPAPPPRLTPPSQHPSAPPPRRPPMHQREAWKGAQAAGGGVSWPTFIMFSALLSSQFPPRTDRNVAVCFQAADQDGSRMIDDKELKRALSSYNQSFSLLTVHLLMYLTTRKSAFRDRQLQSLFGH
ncbi:hypothetical protein Taro_019997 [Colocasia esculenta]|uniref:EF-hand domain-containing protein n=1 Tax=Colocasia esculenta TaxID=4460 RepID=A0A843V774_COLES|nr:hypothetical protein [Colocasia esculenta]